MLITLSNCVLSQRDDDQLPYVEKPGHVKVTTNSITFDEFIIRCSDTEEAAIVAVSWLGNTALKGLIAITGDDELDDDDEDGDESDSNEL